MRSMPEFLPFVRRWFAETFSEATRPQREGWEAIASGRDTLIVAPTGSGKTLAAFLWALDHLHRLGLEKRLEDRVYVVYVSPLRALNNDIEKNLRAPLAGIRAAAAAEGVRLPEVRVAVRTGDTLAAARQAMTRRPPHILITTPESLYILLTSERFRPALAHARFLIVDEIHALMGSKRGAHLALSLERLQALADARGAGSRPQRIGCSATVSPIESALAFLTGATGADAVTVDAGFTRDLDLQVIAPVDDFLTAPSDTIWEAALQQIAELVQAHRTTLVFAQSRRAAERLARDLNDRIPDGKVAAHHGSLSRRARLEAENRLKQGELKALVATSSLELGIDGGALDPQSAARPDRDARGPAGRPGAADRCRGRRRVGGRRHALAALQERLAVPHTVAGGFRRRRALARRVAPGGGQGRRTTHPLGPRERPPPPAARQPLPRPHLGRDDPRRGALRRLRRRDRSQGRHARRGVRHREPPGRRLPPRLARVEDRQGPRRPCARRGRAGYVADDPVLEGGTSVPFLGARPGCRPPPPRRRRPSRRRGLRGMGELGVWPGPARGLGDAAVAGKGGRGPRRCPRRSGRGRRVVPRRAGRTPRDDPFRLRHANQRRLGHGAPREAPASLRPRRGGEPRRRRHPPLVRPGPGPARARAARQARRTGGGGRAPGPGAHRLAALRDALPPRGGARPLYPKNVPGRAHARVPAAPQGRRAPRSGRGSGRVPGRCGVPPRVLHRRVRRPAAPASPREDPRRRALDAPRGHTAPLALRVSAPPRMGLGVPGRRPRRGTPQRRRRHAESLERDGRPAAGGDRRDSGGRAPEDHARAAGARRQRAGRHPRRPRRSHGRRGRGAITRRRGSPDRLPPRRAPGRPGEIHERPAGVDRRARRASLRRARHARGARARNATTRPDARPRHCGVARRALRRGGGRGSAGARSSRRPGARPSRRVPRRPSRAAIRPHRGARGDPAPPGACASSPASRGHSRALLRLPPPAASSPSRPPARGFVRRAGCARAPP